MSAITNTVEEYQEEINQLKSALKAKIKEADEIYADLNCVVGEYEVMLKDRDRDFLGILRKLHSNQAENLHRMIAEKISEIEKRMK